jgi:hypothetical protein
MSVIQEHPAELNYVNAWIGPLAQRPGNFLSTFLEACLRADDENYEILRPALLILMDKYPAPVERLAAEVRDNPCPTS